MKLILFLLFSFATLATNAQLPKSVNSGEFVMECLKNAGELPHNEMVLWIPADFWRIVGEQMKIPADMVDNLVSDMDNYMMFCVVDCSLENQQLIFRSADEIRSSLKLIDSAKMIYLPIAEKDISPNAALLLSRFEGPLEKMLGQFGTGMRIFLFDAKNEKGVVSFNEMKPNRFTLTWDQVKFTWNLPFSSVLPAKYCPVDNEPMKGNWQYCPFHGAKLH